jgi:hypothetical protein
MAFGQVPSTGAAPQGAHFRSVWSEGIYYQIKDSEIIRDSLASKPDQKILPFHNMAWVGVCQGRAWGVERPVPESEQEAGKPGVPPKFDQLVQRILVSDDFKAWHLWSTVVIPRSSYANRIEFIHPISEDVFFAFWQNPIWIGDRADTLCMMKRANGNQFSPESLVMVDLGDTLLAPTDAAGGVSNQKLIYQEFNGKKYILNIKRRLLTMGLIPFFGDGENKMFFPIIESDDGFVIVNGHYGMFWVFDGQGRFRKRINLFELGKDEDLCLTQTYWKFEQCVLGCEPTRDGGLLVAARSETAMELARKEHPLLTEDGKAMPPALYQARKRWAWMDWPQIFWWEIDGKEGKANRISPPLEAPDYINDAIARDGITWEYNRYGDPLFHHHRGH